MLNVRTSLGGSLLAAVLVAVPVMAADQAEQEVDCGYAVDMADEHDFEAFHNCHEDSGLNRFLKDAFKNREIKTKQATAVSSGKVIAPQAPVITEPARQVAVTQPLRSLQKPVMEQMASRYALLLELAEICAHGFAVESEEYRPVVDKGLSLFLNYRCLDAELAAGSQP